MPLLEHMKLRHFRFSRFTIFAVTLFRRFLLPLTIAVVLIGLILFGARAYPLLQRQNIKPVDLLGFFGSPQAKLDSTAGVTNILLLGVRGEGTDSPDLTDTIIVFSYNYDTKVPTLITIPRDLWVPTLKTKINSAYYYGQQASPSAGIAMVQAAVNETLDLPINYTVVINFSLFKQVVDLLGGVDVFNETAFTDNLFPLPGKENAMPITSRYETISFAAGTLHLDGDQALKFVRSRHAEGDQGTDFARSLRQKAVISGIRKQILTPEFLLSNEKVTSLQQVINLNIKTNLPSNLYPALAKLALDTKDSSFRSVGLSDRPDDQGVTILYNPPLRYYAGEWVLIPKDNNYNALKQYLANRLKIPQ